MPSPLDEPEIPTPVRTPGIDTDTSATQTGTGTAKAAPLAIENRPHTGVKGDSEEATKLDLGKGLVVKLDKLGPMIVNSDGTLSRIQNWQDLHPIEQERTVRLLVKKRNLVRLKNLEEQDNGGDQEEPLSALKEGKT